MISTRRARSRTSLRAGLGLAFTLLGALSACGPSAETEERQRIIAAIDALRAASADDVNGRLALADKLAHESAKTPEAIRARDVCAKGYRLLAESRKAELEVTKGLAGKDHDSAVGALKAFDEATKKLDEGRAAVTECSEANTALVLKK